MKKYSIIIPVYNRPQEVQELLESLADQSLKDFEVLIIEDGSTLPCKNIVDQYSNKIEIKYFFNENTGPGSSRNYGMERASGAYILFFDSDCVIPPDYFSKLEKSLAENPADAFGGPDSAHESFTNIQKAINYAMTSFVTTGGIRGKKNNLDNYQPRSFNMGISQRVYQTVGGFSDIHPGEDPDLSYRIMNAGFKIRLIEEAYVWHKRRIDFQKFIKQVYKFGVVRAILIKWYPDKFKPVYLLPSLFLLGTAYLVTCSILCSFQFIFPLLLLTGIIWTESLIKSKNLKIASLSVPAAFIQLLSYGYGFLKSAIRILVFKQNERNAFPSFFFKK
jgi:glycosyltransferase involved in cell wall biosynthesis